MSKPINVVVKTNNETTFASTIHKIVNSYDAAYTVTATDGIVQIPSVLETANTITADSAGAVNVQILQPFLKGSDVYYMAVITLEATIA